MNQKSPAPCERPPETDSASPLQMLSCCTGHPPAPLSPALPADPNTAALAQASFLSPPSARTSIHETDKARKDDSSSEEREHTFQCQSTHELHEGVDLAPCGTHEAKSTWHSLGAQAANGSALAMPHCQEVSTSCPKYTYSSQDIPRSRGKHYHVRWREKWCHHPTMGIYDSLYIWAKFRNPGISRKTRWVSLYRK